MKKFIIFFLVFFTFQFSSAQSWLWESKGIGLGWVNSVAADGHGNCYFSGFFDDYSTLNFSGNILSNPQKNQDGGSMFITKTDKSGHIIWAKQAITYGSSLWGNGYVVALDKSDNIYVTANYNDTIILGSYNFTFLSNITLHYYLAKYTTNGNLLWATQPIVRIDSDDIGTNYVSTDKNGNAFVTGLFNADTVFLGSQILTGSRKVTIPFLVKYDSNGNVLWARQSKWSKTIFDNGTSSCVTNDSRGNAFITGGFEDSMRFGAFKLLTVPPHYAGDVFLVKYDPNGNVIWAKQSVLNSVFCESQGFGLATDRSGNIYVAGDFLDTVTFGSYTLIGARNTYPQGNIFLVKYDSNGNVLWAIQSKDLGSNNWGVGSISIDNYNHIYLSGGGGKGNCEVVFGSDTLGLNDTASQDQASIILKFDSNGNVLCGSIIQGGAQYGNAIGSDTSGNYVYFGSTAGTPLIFGADTVDPFAYPKYVPSWNANYFPFVARWEACDSNAVTASIPNINPIGQVILYPNPNTGTFTIALQNMNDPANVEVYNVLGGKIYQSKLNFSNTQINLGVQPNGVYLYRVIRETGELIGSGKLIIDR